jgi:hypothetical protein
VLLFCCLPPVRVCTNTICIDCNNFNELCDVRTGAKNVNSSGWCSNALFGVSLVSCYDPLIPCFQRVSDGRNLSCTSSGCSLCMNQPQEPTASCASQQQCQRNAKLCDFISVTWYNTVCFGSSDDAHCDTSSGQADVAGDGTCLQSLFGVSASNSLCLNSKTSCFVQAYGPFGVSRNYTCTLQGCSSCSVMPSMPTVSCASVQYCSACRDSYSGRRCDVITGRLSNSSSSGMCAQDSRLFGVNFNTVPCLSATAPCFVLTDGPFGTTSNFSCTQSSCRVCSDAAEVPSTACDGLLECSQCPTPNNNLFGCDVASSGRALTDNGVCSQYSYGVDLSASMYCFNDTRPCFVEKVGPFNVQANYSCTTQGCLQCNTPVTFPTASCASMQACGSCVNLSEGDACDAITGLASNATGAHCRSSLWSTTFLGTLLCIDSTTPCFVDAESNAFEQRTYFGDTLERSFACLAVPTMPQTSCAATQQCSRCLNLNTGDECDIRLGTAVSGNTVCRVCTTTMTFDLGAGGRCFTSMYGIEFDESLCMDADASCFIDAQGPFDMRDNFTCNSQGCQHCNTDLMLPARSCAPLLSCSRCVGNTGQACNASTELTANASGICYDSLYALSLVDVCLGSQHCFLPAIEDVFGRAFDVACNGSSCGQCDGAQLAPSFDCDVVGDQCSLCRQATDGAACDPTTGALDAAAPGLCLIVDGDVYCLGDQDCLISNRVTSMSNNATYRCSNDSCFHCSTATSAPTPAPSPPTMSTLNVGPPLSSVSVSVPSSRASAAALSSFSASLVVSSDSTTSVVASAIVASASGFNATDVIIVVVVVCITVIFITGGVIFCFVIKHRRTHDENDERAEAECANFESVRDLGTEMDADKSMATLTTASGAGEGTDYVLLPSSVVNDKPRKCVVGCEKNSCCKTAAAEYMILSPRSDTIVDDVGRTAYT